MGDRANVVMTKGSDSICLYTHWFVYELPGIVKDALIRGSERWGDYQYLTRIVFCEMTKIDPMGTTGFGITSTICAGDDKIVTINCDDQTVSIGGQNPIPFTEYVALTAAELSDQ